MHREPKEPEIERQSLEVDIACVGFGPAMGGFLTTLVRKLSDEQNPVESKAMPGMPLQVICYERADDVGFGVSGVVTRARGIRASFPEFESSQIPMATPVTQEKVLYLLDPIGASRRSVTLRLADRLIRAMKAVIHRLANDALDFSYLPGFIMRLDGFMLCVLRFYLW